jgi:basic membrane protein A and related proteins
MKSALLLVSCAVIFSACAPQPSPQDCARADVFCAGLVTDFGPITAGINHEAWLGLMDARDAHLANRVDAIETVDVRDRAANIAALADNGYDMIVTVGASMTDDTRAAALKYPEISFIGVEQPQDTNLPNLAGLVFHEERSGFLAGVLAARMTQTGHVAAVCEARFIDPIRRYCDGFQAGARHVAPGINASVDYRDGSSTYLFNDPAWGHDTAVREINAGADVLFAAGGGTATAALEAAASNGILVIGSETDLYPELPEIRPLLLTSATNDIRSGVLELMRLAHRKDLPSGAYIGDAKLAPWHDLDRRIPNDVKQELETMRVGLELGNLPLDIPYKNP